MLLKIINRQPYVQLTELPDKPNADPPPAAQMVRILLESPPPHVDDLWPASTSEPTLPFPPTLSRHYRSRSGVWRKFCGESGRRGRASPGDGNGGSAAGPERRGRSEGPAGLGTRAEKQPRRNGWLGMVRE